MAQIEYSALVSDVKGSLSGTTFKGGKSGAVMQKKRKTKGSRTCSDGHETTHVVQQRIQTVTKSWSGLTASQQETWEGLKGVRGFKNALGKQYTASAYQIYSSMNLIRLALGEAMLVEAPIFDPAPYVPLAMAGPTDCEDDEGNFIDCDTLEPANPVYRASEHAFIISMSRPTNSTRKPNRIVFNVVGIHYFIDEEPVCLTCLFHNWFGSNPPSGSTVWVKVEDTYKGYPVKQNARIFSLTWEATPAPPEE